MSETAQIILGVLFLVVVFILTRIGMVWRIRRAGMFVVKDLENRGALEPDSAVDLPYARVRLIRMGMRDFRLRESNRQREWG